jgi:hypothetical protein
MKCLTKIIAEFQMEMTDLHCDRDLKNAFRHVRLLDFHKFCLSADKFAVPSDNARRMTSVCGSMYIGEHFFSKMKVVKCKSRN